MVVRPAEAKDRPQLFELMKGYFNQLVAEEDGRLHGFASLYACLDTMLADRILVMNDLFVDPSSRNRGTGAALFDASLAYATAQGYARLDWVTAADNHDAQRFYERHGGRRGPWISFSANVRPR